MIDADEKSGLKLISKNQEDIKVISAYLQDSIVKVKNIVFLKKNRIFIMILNRFMWEDAEKGFFRKSKRIKSAVRFEDVIDVKSYNINQKNKNKSLELLAIKITKNFDDNYKLKIFFSGGSLITIIVENINAVLNDFGEAWNTKYTPVHKI